MDFRSQITTPDSLSRTAADALLVVVAGEPAQQRLDAPLAALLDEALRSGDLAAKAGRTLYLHRPAGLKAPRLESSSRPSACAFLSPQKC